MSSGAQALLATTIVALAACASDASPEPEATLDMPGAFVASDAGKGYLELYRILAVMKMQSNQEILFATLYDATPRSWEEARRLARDRHLPVRLQLVAAPRKSFEKNPHQVVWFRTLTDEERGWLP